MTTTRAIAPIATLPVFFKLGGRRVLLAGGTPPAVWKAELLAATGADVQVLATEPCDEMMALVAEVPERLTLQRRHWTRADLDGAALAIGAFADELDGTAFRDAARASGVPVNIIDVPPLCDFQFGTIVERSPLVIGISTDGAAPVLGQALRARIEALLPPFMGAWAQAAAVWREPLQALKLGFAARRRFWECFSDRALEGGDRMPAEADRIACLAAAQEAEASATGRIILVGVGPGDPNLVTLQAVKALQSADVIVYETMTPKAVLGLGRREAKRTEATPEAFDLAKKAVRIGATLAWAGLGDPATCRRWAEPLSLLATLGVPEIVRGMPCPTCPHGCAVDGPQ